MAAVSATAIFARASEIAEQRYPDGANATELAAILREACRELGLTAERRRSEPRSNPNHGRHNKLELLPLEQQDEARRICAARTLESASADSLPCTDRGFVCYACQDLAAEAIKARAEQVSA